MGNIIMVTGGARSGKSKLAEKIAADAAGDVAYVATAIAFDDGMKDRIKKHKDSRPSHWKTYEIYKDLCLKVGLRPLTQRRLSDIIAELDMLGIITTRVISKGRYGRTREVCLAIPNNVIHNVNNILKEGLSL